MKRELIAGLAWAACMLAVSYGATVAHRFGYIDRETVERLALGVVGLWIVWYGNRIPKKFVRSASARKAQRVSGWSQVVSGTVYTLLWASAPIPVATWGGSMAVIIGVGVPIGYCLFLRGNNKEPIVDRA